MSKIIYLIFSNPSEYESNSPKAITWTENEELAKTNVKILTTTHNLAKLLLIDIHDSIRKFEKELAMDERFDQKAFPKWSAGMSVNDITPEMRLERDEIKAYNSKQLELSREYNNKRNLVITTHIYDKYIKESNEEQMKLLKYLGYDNELNFYHQYLRNRYLNKDEPYFYQILEQKSF